MSDLWIVATVLQWVVIAALVVVVLSLLRQVGVLTLKLERAEAGPAAAPPPPDPIGLYQELELPGLARTARPALLAVVQPGCHACEGLEQDLAALTTEADVLLAVRATPAEAERWQAEHDTHGIPTANADDLPFAADLPGTPFALALTRENVVAARGHPAGSSDLVTMLHAAANAALAAGPESVRHHPWGESVPFWEIPVGP